MIYLIVEQANHYTNEVAFLFSVFHFFHLLQKIQIYREQLGQFPSSINQFQSFLLEFCYN
jgi:hypothetical protein